MKFPINFLTRLL